MHMSTQMSIHVSMHMPVYMSSIHMPEPDMLAEAHVYTHVYNQVCTHVYTYVDGTDLLSDEWRAGGLYPRRDWENLVPAHQHICLLAL